ncbi:MAG: ATPase [Myxococcaceae bacterium]|nr:ATPase [Myxococcaceae bacterium]
MLPVGPRLERVLALAYRARRPVLLEGPTGIGKSEIVRHVADALGIATIVLDLSLLEPPDLVGLPVITTGAAAPRTTYALPEVLPTSGAGILMLEELNRAERYIQQPALQLLTARRLHSYELPPEWVCFAAINPESADYQVTPLDKALRARFMNLEVRADRAAWLAWAQTHGVHPGIVALAQNHERIFDEVAPRTWTYAGQVLTTLTPAELADGAFVRDALGGYLPPTWVEALLASKDTWSTRIAFDVRALLADYAPGSPLATEIAAFRDRGQTDRLDEITARLAPLLAGPEAGVLLSQKALSLASFEALIADLPGDHRERLQEALGQNPTATPLVDVQPTELVASYVGSAAERKMLAWKNDPMKHHRVALAITALKAHLEQPSHLAEVKKSNVVRTCMGQLLAQLREKHAMPLVETLKRIGVTPVRPST